MFKWMGWAKWALKVVATAILLSFLCIWTTGYIVNSYMESVVKELDLPLEVQPFALSGVWGKLWGADQPEKKASEEASQPPSGGHESDGGSYTGARETAEIDEPVSGTPSETTGGEEAAGTPTPSEETQAGTQKPDGALAVSGEASAGGGTKQLTDEERQTLYATVVSKLDSSQLQLLSDALKGNLTTEKLDRLKEMLQSALTANEYAQMKEVLSGTPEDGTVAAEE